MPKRAGIPTAVFLCAAGLFFFVFAGAGKVHALIIAAALYIILLLFLNRRSPLPSPVWLPFASGLLIPLMRLFYFDRFDFARRTGLLLLFSLLLSLILLLRALNTWNRVAEKFSRLSRRMQALAIFLITWLLFTAASVVLTKKGVKVAGDEPHYLAISQSIVRDGDLNVFNQYYRDLYKEFVDAKSLPAHGTFGKGYKRIYSYHLPGHSLTLAPFFFARLPHNLLYILIRSYLGLYGALLAVLIYLFSLRVWANEKLSLLAAALFSLTSPVFFYSIHIAPEVQAMLLVLASLYLLLYPGKHENRSALLAGLLLGATLFWGLKYSLFIYLYVPGFFIYFCVKKKYKKALLLLLFPLLFQALFFFYLYYAYGTFSPNAIYYGMLNQEQSRELYQTIFQKIPIRARLETLANYFLDQRDGLLLYSPLYFFAFPGLFLALKKFRQYRWHLLLALPAGLFIANHAFSTIRPGFCPQARYLVPALWALLLFALVYLRETGSDSCKRIFYALPYYAFFVVFFQVLHPATLYQPTTHDILWRPGLMFQMWSNLKINLPSLLPSFIKTDNSRYLPNYVFIGLCLLLAALSLMPKGKTRRPFLLPAAAACLFSLAALFPRPALYNPTLVTPARGMPYLLFEKNPFPREEAAARLLVDEGMHHFLIGTAKKPEMLSMRMENLSDTAEAAVELYLGDQALRGVRLMPKGIQAFSLFGNKGIRAGNLLLYPFHINLTLPAGSKKSSVKVEFSAGKHKEQ